MRADPRPWLIMIVLTTIAIVMLASESEAQTRMATEASYVEAWCNRYAGETEVILEDRTRVDCQTYYHAIEFDFADKWAEAIGQALHYALMTGKRAGIVLIVEDPGAMRYVERVHRIISFYSLPIDVWVDD